MASLRIFSIKPSLGATVGTIFCVLAVVFNFALLNIEGWRFEVFFTASIFGDLIAIFVGIFSMVRMANPLLVFLALISWLTLIGIFLAKAVFTGWMVISALISI